MDFKVGKVATIERKGIQPAGPGLIRGAPAGSFRDCLQMSSTFFTSMVSRFFSVR